MKLLKFELDVGGDRTNNDNENEDDNSESMLWLWSSFLFIFGDLLIIQKMDAFIYR